jgi:hypothetical protein
MTTSYTKLPQKIKNGHEIQKIFLSKTFKNVSKLGFLVCNLA